MVNSGFDFPEVWSENDKNTLANFGLDYQEGGSDTGEVHEYPEPFDLSNLNHALVLATYVARLLHHCVKSDVPPVKAEGTVVKLSDLLAKHSASILMGNYFPEGIGQNHSALLKFFKSFEEVRSIFDAEARIEIEKYILDLLQMKAVEARAAHARHLSPEAKQWTAVRGFLLAGLNAISSPKSKVTRTAQGFDFSKGKPVSLSLMWDQVGLSDPFPIS